MANIKVGNLLVIILFFLSVDPSMAQIKTFTVEAATIAGNFKDLTGVNTGPNFESSTAELCYKDIGVDMVRTHDYKGPCDYQFYTSFYNVTTSTFNYNFTLDNPNDYTWQQTDNQINRIINADAVPFFRLGISFPVGTSNTPATPMPKDADGLNFRTFAGICKRTVLHLTAGWQSNFNLSLPYWEVWNEPNHGLSWTKDSVKSFYRLYKAVSDSLAFLPASVKLGGPGTAKNAFFPSLKHEYVDDFFHYVDSANARLDFYSFHSYDQKNPWHIKNLADTLRYFLDQNNLQHTELIVSETDIYMDDSLDYQDSPKGCAYLTSLLLSAQRSPITKIFWYTGVGLGRLCYTDTLSTSRPSWNGYAYKCYNYLVDETPIELATTGTEIINHANNASDNLMIAAGKSVSGDTINILVSNLKSDYSKFAIKVQDLPWDNLSNVRMTVYRLQDSMKFTSEVTSIAADSVISIEINNVVSNSVYLVKLVKDGGLGMLEKKESYKISEIYPNPFTNELTVESKSNKAENYKIEILNNLGKVVLIKNSNKRITQIDMSSLIPGIYLIFIKYSEDIFIYKAIKL